MNRFLWIVVGIAIVIVVVVALGCFRRPDAGQRFGAEPGRGL